MNCAYARVVISIYDIQRAVAPRSRNADLLREPRRQAGLNQSELPKIVEEFEAITPQSRGEELTRKEKLKTKWAALEALVGESEANRNATTVQESRTYEGG